MEKKTDELDIQALLQQIAATQRRNARSGRITTVAVVLLVTALLISLAVLVPALLDTINEAHATMQNTQELIRQANTSLEKLDGMARSVDTVLKDGGDNLSRIAGVLNSADLQALGNAIQRLNGLIESLSNFRLFG